jgi:putative aldouronate transport system substrate-binding protein
VPNLIPVNSPLGSKQQQIQVYKEAQISKVILANSDAEFNSQYNQLISQLKKMGIDEIDAKKNKEFHRLEIWLYSQESE